jgi:hypothetical protein
MNWVDEEEGGHTNIYFTLLEIIIAKTYTYTCMSVFLLSIYASVYMYLYSTGA